MDSALKLSQTIHNHFSAARNRLAFAENYSTIVTLGKGTFNEKRLMIEDEGGQDHYFVLRKNIWNKLWKSFAWIR